VSVRARGTNGTTGAHENEYDLLTAALIGVTIGAGLTFMLRRGPSGRRPMSPVMRTMGRGASWAGRHAARLGTTGARWAADHGEAIWDRVPRDEIREHVSEYLGRAREAIDDAVESELKDLRRAIRRQRKRLGL
jgi:gas vesicle protein